MQLTFNGTLWYWRGPAPFYFITVPAEQCQDLRAASKLVSYGWGVIPVKARIGGTDFTTSLFPKDARYLVPVKVRVRKAEGLVEGGEVAVCLEIGT